MENVHRATNTYRGKGYMFIFYSLRQHGLPPGASPGAFDNRILPNRQLTDLLPQGGSATAGCTHLIRVALTLALRPAREIWYPPNTLREIVTMSSALNSNAESAWVVR